MVYKYTLKVYKPFDLIKIDIISNVMQDKKSCVSKSLVV